MSSGHIDMEGLVKIVRLIEGLGKEEMSEDELKAMSEDELKAMSEDELKAMVTIYMLCECACSRVLSYLHTHANTPKPPLIPQRETS